MDCIIFIFAIVYLVKRPAFAAKTADQYPDVPAEQFSEWKRLELLSRDIVIWIGFGWIALEVVASIILGGYAFGLAIVGVPVFLITLVVAAVYGSKAGKIKKAHNITV